MMVAIVKNGSESFLKELIHYIFYDDSYDSERLNLQFNTAIGTI
jgi:hypothetical protein